MLTLFLFAYVACMFIVKVPWSEAARSLVIPSLRWDKDYLITVVAVLGTTISPYLFFWQASQEAEDVRTVQVRQILKRRLIRVRERSTGSISTPSSGWDSRTSSRLRS
jgi:Mn2+/Fe2+ NRAMP family transporter